MKRGLSFLLALVLCLSMLPVGVLAEEAELLVTEEPVVGEEQGLDTIIGSGNCGKNVVWSLSDTGVLTISGTGAMADYKYEAPWSDESFSTVVIESGVTHISNNAFCYSEALTSVTIPSSVTSIGNYAFEGCGLTDVTIPSSVTSIGTYAFGFCDLKSITIPSSVTKMGDYAFGWCTDLTNVTISYGVTDIEHGVFEGCDKLASVTIPSSVTYIGESAFYDCYSLLSVTIPASVTVIGGNAFSSATKILYGGDIVHWLHTKYGAEFGLDLEDFLSGTVTFGTMLDMLNATVTLEATSVEFYGEAEKPEVVKVICDGIRSTSARRPRRAG